MLTAEGLTRRYANGLGVFGVSLALRRGEVLCLLGANGSGKTTLLRLLATVDEPTAGRLSWFGIGDRRSPEVRRRLGVMLDRPIHFETLSGRENALFFAAQHGVAGRGARRRIEELAEWAGIAHAGGLPVREYSLGMRRRLALVEALVHDPELLLLDEPSLALDEQAEVDLVGRLRQLSGRGAAVVLATNDVALTDLLLAESLGGRSLRLDGGRIAEPGRAA